MDISSSYVVGQVVFIRTDSHDYTEETVPFRSLDEMVRICLTVRPDRLLDKVVIFAMSGEQPVSLTLGFISASSGQRPGALDEIEG